MLIGELAQRAGVSPKTLRFYEETGVLRPPARTAGGYRVYDGDAVERLAFVRAGQAAGLTLAQVREVIRIREEGEAPCAHVLQLLDDRSAAVTRQIAELRTLKRELDRLRADGATIDPVACDPRSVCQVIVGDGAR